MPFELVKTFRFEAAHRLTNVPDGHKCARLHGHSYRVDVHVIGEPNAQAGWVMDFAEIRSAVAPVLDALDHRLLNDVLATDNPTSETLARHLWQQIRPRLPALSAVTVWESDTSRCTYRP